MVKMSLTNWSWANCIRRKKKVNENPYRYKISTTDVIGNLFFFLWLTTVFTCATKNQTKNDKNNRRESD